MYPVLIWVINFVHFFKHGQQYNDTDTLLSALYLPHIALTHTTAPPLEPPPASTPTTFFSYPTMKKSRKPLYLWELSTNIFWELRHVCEFVRNPITCVVLRFYRFRLPPSLSSSLHSYYALVKLTYAPRFLGMIISHPYMRLHVIYKVRRNLYESRTTYLNQS